MKATDKSASIINLLNKVPDNFYIIFYTSGPKGGNLSTMNDSIKKILAKKAEAIYLMGECSEVLAEAWSDTVPCVKCGTLEEAVSRAVLEAQAVKPRGLLAALRSRIRRAKPC